MVTYPDGTLLKASGPEVAQMEGGQRRWIPDLATLNCMGADGSGIQTIADSVWNLIPQGMPYPSRADGTLLQGSGPQVFVMQTCQRRWIPDPDTFNASGYNWNAIQRISDADLIAISLGEPLPSVDPAPLQLEQVQQGLASVQAMLTQAQTYQAAAVQAPQAVQTQLQVAMALAQGIAAQMQGLQTSWQVAQTTVLGIAAEQVAVQNPEMLLPLLMESLQGLQAPLQGMMPLIQTNVQALQGLQTSLQAAVNQLQTQPGISAQASEIVSQSLSTLQGQVLPILQLTTQTLQGLQVAVNQLQGQPDAGMVASQLGALQSLLNLGQIQHVAQTLQGMQAPLQAAMTQTQQATAAQVQELQTQLSTLQTQEQMLMKAMNQTA